MNKKGLTKTIEWTLIILLVLVAVLIIWEFTRPQIEEAEEPLFINESNTFSQSLTFNEKATEDNLQIHVDCDGDYSNKTFLNLNYGKKINETIANENELKSYYQFKWDEYYYENTTKITLGEFCEIFEMLRREG